MRLSRLVLLDILSLVSAVSSTKPAQSCVGFSLGDFLDDLSFVALSLNRVNMRSQIDSQSDLAQLFMAYGVEGLFADG